MDQMKINGGKVLSGEVQASGSKNAALPILFSSLLADGAHEFSNVPDLVDVHFTCKLLEELGCRTEFSSSQLKVEVQAVKDPVASYELVRKMRASILCLGPLLARYGQAKVSLPGGCAIGTRPIDLHLDGLAAMGAEIQVEGGYVLARTPGRLKGERILFETPTVGGTENLMMAACLAEGETQLENAAKEPEIVDLANCLKKMGAQIEGEGSSIIRIQGQTDLKSVKHEVIPDRIEAGTLLIAGAITGGQVKVGSCRPQDFEPLILKMIEAGFQIERGADWVEVKAQKSFRGVDISTAPHPGFPTDLQAQFMALMTQAEGTSVISETVFENRFMHVQELMRLDADITPKSRVAVVRGHRSSLKAAPVMATDLRASACLVLAALTIPGETQISRIYHLDRGYEKLENKLQALGADIQRV